MSDAQDIVTKIEGMIAYNERGQPIDVYALYDVAEKAGPCIRALLSKCERMEKVARDLRFAYINKDEDCPHKFETDALAQYEAVFGVHADGNSGGGAIRTEDKPNA